MSWILLPDGRIVEWIGVTQLGDSVATGDPLGGILVGQGGPPGSPTEFAGNRLEINQLVAKVVAKGSRLGRGDPLRFEQHFKDHRDLLIRATGTQYPVSPAGQTSFLNDLSSHIAARRLKAIGACTLAKGQPLVYLFRGPVGLAQLTLIMKPNGDWQTIFRAGEGKDLGLRLLLRFDSPHPFVFDGR
jgi:hypothetical protein